MLSIKKLEELLLSYGLEIKKIFTIDDYAVYIEVFINTDADTFMIYIPSRYEIKVKDGYKIKYVNVDDDGELIKKEKENLEEYYEEIEFDLSPRRKNEDLEDTLKDNYNRNISLLNLVKEDGNNIKEIYYHLTRLKLCVQSINYKLCIIYKNYLCCIRKDNSIDCFIISNYSKNNIKRILVLVDLEIVYSKIANLKNDIKTVKKNIFKILDQNQSKHTNLLNKLLDQKELFATYSISVYNKKKEINDCLYGLENLLLKINENEEQILEKLTYIKDRYSSKDLNIDIERTQQESKYQYKLENMNSVRQEIIKDIIRIRSEQENLMLISDKIFFNNSIMINTININLNNLLKNINLNNFSNI